EIGTAGREICPPICRSTKWGKRPLGIRLVDSLALAAATYSRFQPLRYLGRRRIASGDPLNHRHVDIWVCVAEGLSIDREETLERKERRAVVAIGRWVVAREPLN